MLNDIKERIAPYLESPYVWLALGVVVLVLVLWLLGQRQPGRIVAFKGKSGNIFITRKAIHQLVQKVCDSIPEVGKCHTRIFTRGRALKIELRFQALAGSQIQTVTGELQERVEKVLRETTGIERTLKVNPVVSGFFGEVVTSTVSAQREKLDHAVYDEEVLLPEEDDKDNGEMKQDIDTSSPKDKPL